MAGTDSRPGQGEGGEGRSDDHQDLSDGEQDMGDVGVAQQAGVGSNWRAATSPRIRQRLIVSNGRWRCLERRDQAAT
jgi:hypothetical protein